jgi:hypothetical protein
VNRRQFLGASLSTTIASAALPWDPFVQWFKTWFGEVKRVAKSTLTTFDTFLKERYADADVESLVYGDSPFMAFAKGTA